MSSARKCPANPSAVALQLGELRRRMGLSQAALARRLQVKQPHIAQLEHREDMYLTTLIRYIEALGGELELTARFPEMVVAISPADTPPAAAEP